MSKDIASTTTNKNVVEPPLRTGLFKVFGKPLRQAGMADTLKGAGPFTLFAPTDAAFHKLPAASSTLGRCPRTRKNSSRC